MDGRSFMFAQLDLWFLLKEESLLRYMIVDPQLICRFLEGSTAALWMNVERDSWTKKCWKLCAATSAEVQFSPCFSWKSSFSDVVILKRRVMQLASHEKAKVWSLFNMKLMKAPLLLSKLSMFISGDGKGFLDWLQWPNHSEKNYLRRLPPLQSPSQTFGDRWFTIPTLIFT